MVFAERLQLYTGRQRGGIRHQQSGVGGGIQGTAARCQAVGNLVRKERDCWILGAVYVVNKHLALTVSYGCLGNIMIHNAKGIWGVTTKHEF
jgi:hypothetical protein